MSNLDQVFMSKLKENRIKVLLLEMSSLFNQTHFASSSLIADFRLPYSPPFTKLTPVFRSQPPFGALSWKISMKNYF